MLSGYIGWFLFLTAVCAVLVIRSRSVNKEEVTKEFTEFRKNFLIVYLMAMLSDWLQGPYVYKLYKDYGYSKEDIAILFIAGFGSSMVFGTIVGAMADKYGRKNNAMLFGVIYGLSCVTKHFPNYHILMIGRLLGGMATSILYSAFESWMVAEHTSNAFPPEWLSSTFALMTFGNGIVAIAAGVIASAVAGLAGSVAPFDCSLLVLIALTVVVHQTWTENYGDRSVGAGLNLQKALDVMQNNPRVLLVGLIQSCFESAMYLFVFSWTPQLEVSLGKIIATAKTDKADDVGSENLPHGLIFAGFMVCIMIGSNLFGSIVKNKRPEDFMRAVFALSSLSMSIMGVSDNHVVQLLACCIFEVCCGFYFPGLGTQRGKYIPEDVRATLMNIFRIGLNLIVVGVLYNIHTLFDYVWVLSAFLLGIAAVAQHILHDMTTGNKLEQAAAMAQYQDLEKEDFDEELGDGDAEATSTGVERNDK